MKCFVLQIICSVVSVESHDRRRRENSSMLRSAELFSESNENIFRATDVTKTIHVQILDYFTYELRAMLLKPLKRAVNVLNGEHNSEIA